jgi:RimJ/RimL family protein N-acetyltransferase
MTLTTHAVADDHGLPGTRVREWIDKPGCEGVWVALDRVGDASDDGGAVDFAGVLRAYRTPDDRLRLIFTNCPDRAYPVLAGAVAGAALTQIDDGRAAAMDALQRCGFRAERRELLLQIPVADHQRPVPAGIGIVSAADLDPEQLMHLDARLRDDVPAASGWQPDLAWFIAENHHSPQFDPPAYLVALDGDQPIGLVRIWNRPDQLPRAGMWAVLPDHRGRGIASALLSRALAVWHHRGGTVVCTEIDETNSASLALAARFGATVVGGTTELIRA